MNISLAEKCPLIRVCGSPARYAKELYILNGQLPTSLFICPVPMKEIVCPLCSEVESKVVEVGVVDAYAAFKTFMQKTSLSPVTGLQLRFTFLLKGQFTDFTQEMNVAQPVKTCVQCPLQREHSRV